MLSLRRTSALARLAGARSTTHTRQMSSQVRPRSRARAAPPAFHHRNINPKIPPSRRAQRSIRVSPELEAFVEQRVLPGTGVPAQRFWSGLDSIVATLGPRNEALLRQRDALQAQIDGFAFGQNPGLALGSDVESDDDRVRRPAELYIGLVDGADPDMDHVEFDL